MQITKNTIQKTGYVAVAIAVMFLFTITITFAAPAFTPGQTLDPASLEPNCTPGGLTGGGDDCTVGLGWTLDLANDYVYNITDSIGIGTATPSVALDVVGDSLVTAELPSGGYQVTRSGDLSAYGGDEGFISIAIDSFTPTAYAVIRSDLRTNEPRIALTARNANYDIGLNLDASDGGIDLTTDSDGDIYIANDTGVLTLNSAGRINIGVNEGITTPAGEYRAGFSVDPYDTVHSMVAEVQRSQQYAYGWAGLDDGSKIYSNIYYGSLDAGNIISDITRIEASNFGATSTFMYDTINGYTNTIDINSSGINIIAVDGSGSSYFALPNNGDAVLARATDGVALSVQDDDNTCDIDPDTGVSCSSDRTLKTDINTLNGGLDLVMQLKPVTYHWIANPDQPQNYGFIAQDVQEVMPELVTTGSNGKLVLNQTNMIAPIVSAIQTLQSQLTDRAVVLIDNVKEIFVKKVTTDELCIGDVCFDEEEAQTLKDLIDTGVVTHNSFEQQQEQEVVEESEEVQEEEVVVEAEAQSTEQSEEEVSEEENLENTEEEEQVVIEEEMVEQPEEETITEEPGQTQEEVEVVEEVVEETEVPAEV